MNRKVLSLVHAAVIAALYVVLTFAANLLGLSNGVIQIRFSEALTILPFFTPAAIPGLFVGCLLANLLTGALPWDVVFGSLATLIGAFGTYLLRGSAKPAAQTAGTEPAAQAAGTELPAQATGTEPAAQAAGTEPPARNSDAQDAKTAAPKISLRKWFAPLPPILANTVIIPFILAYAYRFEGSILYFMLTVGIGEFLSCGVLGILLLNLLLRYRRYIFPIV